MMNRFTCMGRLVRDPELRRTGTGVAVTSFRIAIDRDFVAKDDNGRKADFFDCVAWRQTAEFVNKYFSKGRMIGIDGHLEVREWTDKDGNKRNNVEIIIDNAYFADSKRDSDSKNEPNYPQMDDDGARLPFDDED